MRAQKFDWVIDLQGLARSGAFAWLANGSSSPASTKRAKARGDFTTSSCRAPRFTRMRWTGISPCCRTSGCRFTTISSGCRNGPTAAAAVQAKWPAPRRPLDRAATRGALGEQALAGRTFRRIGAPAGGGFPDVRFAILGSADDEPLGEIISRAAPERCLNLAGQTSLPEMIEWLRRCELMVTNDTGPMHVAAALGKPVVAVFGPTEPRRTGPYGQRERVVQTKLPCVPCLKSRCAWPQPMECMTGMSPQRGCLRARGASWRGAVNSSGAGGRQLSAGGGTETPVLLLATPAGPLKVNL